MTEANAIVSMPVIGIEKGDNISRICVLAVQTLVKSDMQIQEKTDIGVRLMGKEKLKLLV